MARNRHGHPTADLLSSVMDSVSAPSSSVARPWLRLDNEELWNPL